MTHLTTVQHPVTDVDGPIPKTAFAGWFCSPPDFLLLLKQTAGEQWGEAGSYLLGERQSQVSKKGGCPACPIQRHQPCAFFSSPFFTVGCGIDPQSAY